MSFYDTLDGKNRGLRWADIIGPRTHTARPPAPVKPFTGTVTPYAQAALDRECADLAAAPEGTRNDRLNAAAFNLGQLVAGGELDRATVEQRLTDAAKRNGDYYDNPNQVTSTITSGIESGMSQPRTTPHRENTATASDPEPAGPRRPTLTAMSQRDRAHRLTNLDNVFRKWLGKNYDLDAIHAVLAADAVHTMNSGDLVWLLLLSGPANAKTETVQAVSKMRGTLSVSTITSEGALLSATTRRDRAADATGGILREIGESGILVIKDVTSILSMSRELRGQVLGALRECYDGGWTRKVGVDGGRSLEWKGRLTVIGAVTSAWDTHHEVTAAMGDRFVVLRINSGAGSGRQDAARQAIGNTGNETRMRDELAEAAASVLEALDPTPVALADDDTATLIAAADLVTMARTAAERDRHGNVDWVHAPEMPTRYAKQLAQIVRGACAIGMTRPRALALALRCARDSVPPRRLAILEHLHNHNTGTETTTTIRKALSISHNTADRELQALHMLGLVHRSEAGTGWHYRLAESVDPTVLGGDPSGHERGGGGGNNGDDFQECQDPGADTYIARYVCSDESGNAGGPGSATAGEDETLAAGQVTPAASPFMARDCPVCGFPLDGVAAGLNKHHDC